MDNKILSTKTISKMKAKHLRHIINLLILVLLTLTSGCLSKREGLRIGVIAPSTDWLPVAIAIEKEMFDDPDIKLYRFSSGWEANEAIIAGKIDVAIIPFTYAWKGVAEGKDIRTISFFERESDGIITHRDITDITQLDGKKIGVLRASTLDIFVHLVAEKYEFQPEIIYFRTPTEMAAALQNGLVDALSYYVPQIFRIAGDFEAAYWYGEDYPDHPCCDIVATQTAIKDKKQNIASFFAGLHKACLFIEDNKEASIAIMRKNYNLSEQEAERTLNHTGFIVGLDKTGILFQQKTAAKMKELGYLKRIPDRDEIFYYGFLED